MKKIIIFIFLIVTFSSVSSGFVSDNNSYNQSNRSNIPGQLNYSGPTTYRVGVNEDGFYTVLDTKSNEMIHADVTNIYTKDKIVWINDVSEDKEFTIISIQRLWKDTDAILRPSSRQFNYTFNEPGMYGFYFENDIKKRQTINVTSAPIIETKKSSASVQITPQKPAVIIRDIDNVRLYKNNTPKNSADEPDSKRVPNFTIIMSATTILLAYIFNKKIPRV